MPGTGIVSIVIGQIPVRQRLMACVFDWAPWPGVFLGWGVLETGESNQRLGIHPSHILFGLMKALADHARSKSSQAILALHVVLGGSFASCITLRYA